MKEIEMLRRQFGDVTTVQPHKGYYYRVKDALIIAILGSLCGLSDMKDIHQWSENPHVREFLTQTFEMFYFPCYSWFNMLMRLVDSEWLNQQFSALWQQILPENRSSYQKAKYSSAAIQRIETKYCLGQRHHVL